MIPYKSVNLIGLMTHLNYFSRPCQDQTSGQLIPPLCTEEGGGGVYSNGNV